MMKREDAIKAAKQIGIADGQDMSIQSEGQIENPHHHAGEASSEPTHVDAWAVTNNDGEYTADKMHSDDT